MEVLFGSSVPAGFIGCEAIIHADGLDFAPSRIARPIVQGTEERFHRKVALLLAC